MSQVALKIFSHGFGIVLFSSRQLDPIDLTLGEENTKTFPSQLVGDEISHFDEVPLCPKTTTSLVFSHPWPAT